MPHASVPDKSIAYINQQGQVCVIAPAGDECRLLTSTRRKRVFRFPAWSPDGTHVATIGRTRGSAGVFVLPIAHSSILEASVARALYVCTIQRPFYLYWSPDSRAISFAAAHPHGLGLHLVDREGSEHRLLTVGQPCFWDWTPSADQMLIHTGGNGQLARLLSIDVRSADRYEGFGRPGLFQAPGIAPSGHYWAFDEEDSDGGRHLVITSRQHKTRHSLEHVGGVAFGWSPTSDLLAYICPTRSFHHFYGPLRLFDVASQQERILAEETVLAFFWSPDGQQIAYLTMATTPPLGNADGWAPSNGVASNGHHNGSNGYALPPHTSVRISTEDDPVLNLWVVNVQNNQRRLLTAFQPSEEFVTQFMPFFDQYILSHRLWSPASDALVLSIVADQRPQVMIMPLNGEQPRIIAEGSMAFWSPNPLLEVGF